MPTAAQPQDVEAIKQAVLDYVEGVDLVDPLRIQRSVRPDLAKTGFVREGDHYVEYRMTFTDLVEAAKTYNQDGHISANTPRTITIYDVLDQIATVKLEAWWGIDYLHLVKQSGNWMIVQAVWQTYPPTEAEQMNPG